MAGSRPQWARADVPLVVLVGVVLVLAFVLPGYFGSSDPPPQTPLAGASGSPRPTATASPSASGDDVLPASPVTPGVPPALKGRTGRSATQPPAVSRPGTCVEVAAPRLTAASFNIHSARARSGNGVELDRIAAEIRGLNADVVLLEEVDRGRQWTGRVDQPAYLAQRLGMYYAFGPNVVRGPSNQYGTAILSRYPITGAQNTLLPNGPGGQQRGLLHVRVEPAGTPVSVYVTHLENTSASIRDAQARAIAGIVARDPLPTILGGDLNSTPRTSAMATLDGPLDDSWPASGVGSGATHPAGNPVARIDYLLYANGVQPLQSVVVPSTVSDHRAVRTMFQVGEPTKVCLPSLDN